MANKGDIQHNLKTVVDSELYFSREVTSKSSGDYGKLKTKKGIYRFPYLTRMTGESIKGTTETIESNELRKGRTASKKRLGNESAEGSLDIELSPQTFDDNLAAALKNEWKVWTSDNNSAINLDGISCATGEFLTRAIVSLGKDQYGNWGADFNTTESFTPRLLLNDGTASAANGLIDVPAGCVVHELTCGSEDIKYDVLRHLGGAEDEDLYQRYAHMAVNTLSLDVQIGSIVTGSFGFMGTNNPIRKNESQIRVDYGNTASTQFEESGMTGDKFVDSLPDKSTDTDQFTSMEGNLWVNGKNITTGISLSLELNNNMERKNAIFVKKAIATTSQKLDITGSLSSYVVFGETEGLYNLGVTNATNEILFLFQDKETNPEHLYLFQIFKSAFDSPDAGGSDTCEDTFNFSSFEERALRILRITYPKPSTVEFTAATNWTDAGTIKVVPNAELAATTDLTSYSITDTLKKADGTTVDTQTITTGATISDGCLQVTESAFTTTTDGAIRVIDVTFNGKTEYKVSKTFSNESAPADVTGLTATAGNKRFEATWTDPVTDELDHVTVKVSHTESSTTVVDSFENVNAGVQAYNLKGLTNGTQYTIEIHSVGINGKTSTTGATTTVTPSAS